MASKQISRLTTYVAGQTIDPDEHNSEHQQYVDNFNELFKSFDYDGNYHYLFADKTRLSFSDKNVDELLSLSHNPDGTIKADSVVYEGWGLPDLPSFLAVSHNPDGTVKVDDATIEFDGALKLKAGGHNHDDRYYRKEEVEYYVFYGHNHKLGDLEDVDVSSRTNGTVLVWDVALGKYKHLNAFESSEVMEQKWKSYRLLIHFGGL